MRLFVAVAGLLFLLTSAFGVPQKRDVLSHFRLRRRRYAPYKRDLT